MYFTILHVLHVFISAVMTHFCFYVCFVYWYISERERERDLSWTYYSWTSDKNMNTRNVYRASWYIPYTRAEGNVAGSHKTFVNAKEMQKNC